MQINTAIKFGLFTELYSDLERLYNYKCCNPFFFTPNITLSQKVKYNDISNKELKRS